ncbi:MAG: hypothetical protein WKF83_09915 [Nocardioidaceae bacterium]
MFDNVAVVELPAVLAAHDFDVRGPGGVVRAAQRLPSMWTRSSPASGFAGMARR